MKRKQFQLSREHKQEQMHQNVFNYYKTLNTIIRQKSNVLDQENENLNNTTKRVTAPKKFKIFLQNWNIHAKCKEKHLTPTYMKLIKQIKDDLILEMGKLTRLLDFPAGDPGSISGLGRSPGKGNVYPLQYSCLENSMDRGSWHVTVHGVAKNQDTIEWLTFSFFTFTRFLSSNSIRYI